MTDEVPEGQLPRDKKFWATYHAVNAEIEHRERRGACMRDRSHEIVIGRRDQPVACGRCDADYGRMLADATAWRVERTTGGRPQPGDVLYHPGDVIWTHGQARVVRNRTVVEQDRTFRVDLHPVGYKLPTFFSL